MHRQATNKLPCRDTYLIGCSTPSHCILSGLILIHAHKTEMESRMGFPRFCAPSLLAKKCLKKNDCIIKVLSSTCILQYLNESIKFFGHIEMPHPAVPFLVDVECTCSVLQWWWWTAIMVDSCFTYYQQCIVTANNYKHVIITIPVSTGRCCEGLGFFSTAVFNQRLVFACFISLCNENHL